MPEKGLQPSNRLKAAPVTPREGRLSAEQAERVQRLMSEGMAASFARAEVLGEEDVP